eukprot:COSAG06_NODE_299_length_18009_cov_6.715952_12_plen_158_part_00
MVFQHLNLNVRNEADACPWLPASRFCELSLNWRVAVRAGTIHRTYQRSRTRSQGSPRRCLSKSSPYLVGLNSCQVYQDKLRLETLRFEFIPVFVLSEQGSEVLWASPDAALEDRFGSVTHQQLIQPPSCSDQIGQIYSNSCMQTFDCHVDHWYRVSI